MEECSDEVPAAHGGGRAAGEAASRPEEAPGRSHGNRGSRPPAENRKVGGPLEELLSRDAPVQAAAEYLAFLAEHPEYSPERVPELVRRGDDLLESAGSLEAAGVATATAWWERNGFHLRGVFDARLEHMVDHQLLRYARAVAAEGVRTRYRGTPFRRRALPHPSAKDHVHEIMAALWKDAAKGRVLVCTDTHAGILRHVISVSMARVPKQNPDRTLSAEGRLIWDGTFPNLLCPKGDHPPGRPAAARGAGPGNPMVEVEAPGHSDSPRQQGHQGCLPVDPGARG